MPRPAGGAGAVGCRGLRPVGATPPVYTGLKVQGSGSPYFFVTPYPMGARMGVSWGFPPWLSLPRLRVTPFVTVFRGNRVSAAPAEAHPAAVLPPRAGGARRNSTRGREPEPSHSPLPACRLPVAFKNTSREGKSQTLHVCSGKRRDCEQELLTLAQQEAKLISGAEVVFSSTFHFRFGCFGLLFSGKIAATPVGVFSKGLAGELDSSQGSAACSF